jgi:hypothetical protein
MAKEPKLEFKNKDEERSAKEDFTNLLNHPGWQRVVKYYDQKIEYLEHLILEDKEAIQSVNDLKLLRARRNMAMQFRNLPDIIMAKEELEIPEINLDPFE